MGAPGQPANEGNGEGGRAAAAVIGTAAAATADALAAPAPAATAAVGTDSSTALPEPLAGVQWSTLVGAPGCQAPSAGRGTPQRSGAPESSQGFIQLSQDGNNPAKSTRPRLRLHTASSGSSASEESPEAPEGTQPCWAPTQVWEPALAEEAREAKRGSCRRNSSWSSRSRRSASSAASPGTSTVIASDASSASGQAGPAVASGSASSPASPTSKVEPAAAR